jgi:hypothetical protein
MEAAWGSIPQLGLHLLQAIEGEVIPKGMVTKQ